MDVDFYDRNGYKDIPREFLEDFLGENYSDEVSYCRIYDDVEKAELHAQFLSENDYTTGTYSFPSSKVLLVAWH